MAFLKFPLQKKISITIQETETFKCQHKFRNV